MTYRKSCGALYSLQLTSIGDASGSNRLESSLKSISFITSPLLLLANVPATIVIPGLNHILLIILVQSRRWRPPQYQKHHPLLFPSLSLVGSSFCKVERCSTRSRTPQTMHISPWSFFLHLRESSQVIYMLLRPAHVSSHRDAISGEHYL
jgi:hypothetical protein